MLQRVDVTIHLPDETVVLHSKPGEDAVAKTIKDYFMDRLDAELNKVITPSGKFGAFLSRLKKDSSWSHRELLYGGTRMSSFIPSQHADSKTYRNRFLIGDGRHSLGGHMYITFIDSLRHTSGRETTVSLRGNLRLDWRRLPDKTNYKCVLKDWAIYFPKWGNSAALSFNRLSKKTITIPMGTSRDCEETDFFESGKSAFIEIPAEVLDVNLFQMVYRAAKIAKTIDGVESAVAKIASLSPSDDDGCNGSFTCNCRNCNPNGGLGDPEFQYFNSPVRRHNV